MESKKDIRHAFDLLEACSRKKADPGTLPIESDAEKVERLVQAQGSEVAKLVQAQGSQPKTTFAESRTQTACVSWFNSHYPELEGCLFHIPNEGKKSIRQGARWKALGGVAGVADLVLIYQGTCAFFELKAAKGVLSERQKAWRAIVQAQGFHYHVIRNVEDFKDLAAAWLEIQGYRRNEG